MNRIWITRIITFLISISVFSIGYSCTDFRSLAKDGSIIITRSMEFALPLHSNLRSSPKGRVFTTQVADGKPGLHWTAKYGYLYLDGMNVDFAIDGMNQVGLSFEALYLPGLAVYQTAQSSQTNQSLPYYNVGDWILSNFQSVDEVKQALSKITVVASALPGFTDTIFPLHFSVYEPSGKGIIIEYVKGKMTIYDSIGVLTNSPSYDWHVTNLLNYIHLSPLNPPPVVAQGITYEVNGQGFGMIGLPGDISPPSRFVKVATLMHVAIPMDDAISTLTMAQHIINNVDIVLGEAREPSTTNATSELTQWVVFKDLTHKLFYYRTYDNLSLRVVDLNKINVSENAPRLSMPIETKPFVQDVTSSMMKATESLATPSSAPAPLSSVTH